MCRLLTVAALALCLGPAACGAGSPPSEADQTGPVSPARVTSPDAVPSAPAIHVDTLADASQVRTGPGVYQYRVEVPQVVSSTVHGQAVNAAIRGTLQRDVADFLDAAKSGPAAPEPSDLTCVSRTVRVTARLAVLRVDCSEYVAGAAHANTATHTFNCDLAAGRVLALQDVFSPGSAYLEVLSTAARTQLRTKLDAVDDQTLSAGTAPAVNNFKAYLLAGDGLVIVFAKYQVAAGAAGQPEVAIPYGDLQRYFARGISDLLAS